MAGLLGLLAIGFVLALAGSIAYTAWMLTHPPRRTLASALARGKPSHPGELAAPLSYTTWALHTAIGRVEVWDVAGEDPLAPIVVMVHGWGDSRLGGLSRLPTLARGASRVLLFDLAGHGESPGWCSLGTRRELDLLARLLDEVALDIARDGLAEQSGGSLSNESPGVGVREPTGENSGSLDRPIVVYGWSMGAGIAIACAHASIAGVIAEAPYRLARTPARNVLRSARLPYRLNLAPALFVLNLLLRGGLGDRVFDRARLASTRERRALLVIHGERDDICPSEDGRAIADAAGGEFALIDGGDHNNLWSEPTTLSQCERAVLSLLARVQTRGASRHGAAWAADAR